MVDRRFRLARIWSNQELEKIAGQYTGRVLNVSAGDDVDKQGRHYRDYFSSASSYSISNFQPGSKRGFQGREHEILIDLEGEVAAEHRQVFDVCFNHTTLEHIYEVQTAFRNLCALSADTVILVVPFCQVQHESEFYKDYWRFSPTAVRRMFHDQGFEVVYESANDHFNAAVYLFFVASRNAESWRSKMPAWQPIGTAGTWVGNSLGKLLRRRLRLG